MNLQLEFWLNKPRSACLNGRLKNIVVILEYILLRGRYETEARHLPNHVDVISYCLSNELKRFSGANTSSQGKIKMEYRHLSLLLDFQRQNARETVSGSGQGKTPA